MTEEYKYGRDIDVSHMQHPTSMEDGYIIRAGDLSVFEKFLEDRKANDQVIIFEDVDMLARLEVDLSDGDAIIKFTDVFYGVKAQERILKHGSHRMKVAMKRARRWDGDKHTKKSGPFLGEIRSLDLAFELVMLRAGASQEDRHPKHKPELNRISSAFFSDAAGTVRDIREMDYLNVLKQSDQLNLQTFDRIRQAGKHDHQ